jgi:hypothetical protein
MILFLFFLFLLLLFECMSIIFIYTILSTLVGFENISSGNISLPTQFLPIERLYSFVFNKLYFANALGGTTAFNSDLFWSFIELRCSPLMNRGRCYKDFIFSVGDCLVDSTTCIQLQKGDGYACPYNQCRQQVASFSTDYIYYFTFLLTFLLLLHILAFTVSCILYTNREFEFKVHQNNNTTDSEIKQSHSIELARRTSLDRESPREVVLTRDGNSSPDYFKDNIFKETVTPTIRSLATGYIASLPPSAKKKTNFTRKKMLISVDEGSQDVDDEEMLFWIKNGAWKIENQDEPVFHDVPIATNITEQESILPPTNKDENYRRV